MSEVTSVAKLKALLEAIDLLTDQDEWVPSSKQWTRIREMIETLEEVALAPAPMRRVTGPAPAAAHDAASANPVLNGTLRVPVLPVADDIVIGQPNRGGASSLTPAPAVDQPGGDAVPLADGEVVENPPNSPGL